jgi:hypothetical protein
MHTIVKKGLGIAAITAGLAFAGAASATPIAVAFNFVPFGSFDCNGAAPGPGNITTATSCTSGAPLLVSTILLNNVGLVSGQGLAITDPTPLTLGAEFTKTFSTALGNFTELLTITNVSVGATSLGIIASGTISCTACVGLDSTSVFYSAAYTQNGGPGSQINASFNNSTIPFRVPEPGTLALLGLGLAAFGFVRRRKQ